MTGVRWTVRVAALVGFLLHLEGAHAGVPAMTTEFVADVGVFPTYITHVPGDPTRLFVSGRQGNISIIRDGAVLPTCYLDIINDVRTARSQDGLLSFTFDPDYQTNGFFYVNYTREPDGAGVVVRYQMSADPDVADAQSAHPIIAVPQNSPTHNLDWIGFSPNDGYLYLSVGEDGPDNAQDLDLLLGKILRIDVDGDDFPEDDDNNYAVPPDNPLVGAAGREEIWAWGLRNPWRASFDRLTGDFYIGDVGAADWEEVNYQSASSTGGENYGWNCKEATHCTKNKTCECMDPSVVDPIVEYPNPAAGGAAVIGGYVYRGCAIPDLQGALIFGDRFGTIWMLRHDNGNVTEFVDITATLDPPGPPDFNSLTSFGEDVLGEIYIAEQNGPLGGIYKIVSTVLPDPDCNGNGVLDACDIAGGMSNDLNGNGIPDECECPWDLDNTNVVGTADLLNLLAQWGTDPGGPPDFNGDGNVSTADLLELLGAWGPCPK